MVGTLGIAALDSSHPCGGRRYHHHSDALGSTRLLADSSQAITDTYDYYAFAEIQSSSGSTANPFKFVGRLGYYDDPSTDFQYLRARYYAPASGRFLSGDPLPLAGENRYLYGYASAAGATDPSGMVGNTPCPPAAQKNPDDKHCRLVGANSRIVRNKRTVKPGRLCVPDGPPRTTGPVWYSGSHPTSQGDSSDGIPVTCEQDWLCYPAQQVTIRHLWKCWWQFECSQEVCHRKVYWSPPPVVDYAWGSPTTFGPMLLPGEPTPDTTPGVGFQRPFSDEPPTCDAPNPGDF
jgi:RHS repeat-associated protein